MSQIVFPHTKKKTWLSKYTTDFLAFDLQQLSLMCHLSTKILSPSLLSVMPHTKRRSRGACWHTDYILHNAQLTKFWWAEYISLRIIHDGVWKLMSLLKVAWSFRSGIWSELQIGWGGMTHFWLYCKESERGSIMHAIIEIMKKSHSIFSLMQSSQTEYIHFTFTVLQFHTVFSKLICYLPVRINTCASDCNALFSVNCFSFRLR